jgi:hypothetical protein
MAMWLHCRKRPFPRSLSGCAEREGRSKGFYRSRNARFALRFRAALACNRMQSDAPNRANQPGFFLCQGKSG